MFDENEKFIFEDTKLEADVGKIERETENENNEKKEDEE